MKRRWILGLGGGIMVAIVLAAGTWPAAAGAAEPIVIGAPLELTGPTASDEGWLC